MRGELIIDRLPSKMVNNRVLVFVKDTFVGYTTKGGIHLVNLTTGDTWGDSKEYNISEFVMRHGRVVMTPKVITPGSFTYHTECEVKPGDTVWWNLAGFSQHIPLIHNDNLYLLVDYHEIIAKMSGDEVIPVNGNGLFSPVREETQLLAHTIVESVSDTWKLEKLPEKNVRYFDSDRQPAGCWTPGDRVRLLVRRSPYKLEGNINTLLDKDLYCCPMNYVICTC